MRKASKKVRENLKPSVHGGYIWEIGMGGVDGDLTVHSVVYTLEDDCTCVCVCEREGKLEIWGRGQGYV